jgi:hypothetical protein
MLQSFYQDCLSLLFLIKTLTLISPVLFFLLVILKIPSHALTVEAEAVDLHAQLLDALLLRSDALLLALELSL